jgi:hypothetical protein
MGKPPNTGYGREGLCRFFAGKPRLQRSGHSGWSRQVPPLPLHPSSVLLESNLLVT